MTYIFSVYDSGCYWEIAKVDPSGDLAILALNDKDHKDLLDYYKMTTDLDYYKKTLLSLNEQFTRGDIYLVNQDGETSVLGVEATLHETHRYDIQRELWMNVGVFLKGFVKKFQLKTGSKVKVTASAESKGDLRLLKIVLQCDEDKEVFYNLLENETFGKDEFEVTI